MEYRKCYDRFNQPLKEGDYVDVQKDGVHQIYKKVDGQLYFKPYGKEDMVSAYFSNDIAKCDVDGNWINDDCYEEIEEEFKYPIGGYAPGNYMCNCSTCEKQFIGDKRAVQCEPCAIEMTKKETFEEYLQNLKDRRTEDSYKYTDEDFENYIHHIFDCYEKNISVYKCLEFMYFIEREVKLEDIFNDEKKEDVKKIISEHKEKLQKEQDEFTIKFANWLRKEDTQENADKYFHYSDMDMLNAFKKENKS